jgi:hypothetical protein
MTATEYLACEREQKERHEYLAGEVRQIASPTDYVLVSQSTARVEHFKREANGEWHDRVVGAGGRIELTNGAVIGVDAIYAGVFELEGD